VFGKLSDEEQVDGIIIRSEEVLNVEKGQKIQKIKENNEKVSKNEIVAKVSTQNEQDIMKKIEEVNKKIEQALSENQINVNSAQNITINEKIERVLAHVSDTNFQSKIEEYDKEIKNSLYEKAKISGELTKEGSKLKNLIKEKENLEATLNSNTKNVISTSAGNISYIVDGYEQKLKADNFEYLTEDILKSVDIKRGTVLSVSDNKAKIIKDFNTYIACIVKKDRLKDVKRGKTLELNINNEYEALSMVEYIKDIDNSKSIVVFSTNKLSTELSKYRKISLGIIWWSEVGLKVSNKAIKKIEKQHFVVKNKSGFTELIPVKLIKETEEYSLVSGYASKLRSKQNSKELIDIPILQEFDEVILNPKISDEEASVYLKLDLNNSSNTEEAEIK
jgi:hypothetical protein